MPDAIHVLYVDDEPVLLKIGKLFLEKDGEFSIETIESAPAALEILGTKRFDAIISDYQMPVMDGIQFLIEVRARFGKIPFILFTGKGREEIVIQAINNGADFYLQKGGNPDAQFAELSHQVMAIVSQRAAEKAFTESENRYRSLVQNMHDCVAVYRAVDNGADFEILEFNHAAERTENVTREEVVGRRVTDVFPGVQDFGILDVFRQVWNTGIPESFPVSLYQDNRISGWRDNFVFKLPSGEIVASYSDETARKKAEASLKESEERLRTMIDQSPLSIQVLSPDGRTVQVNHAFEELWGVTLADLADYNIFRDEQITRLGIMPFIKRGFSGETVMIPPVQYNTRETIGAGEKRWVLARIYPVRDSKGSIQDIVLQHEDITDRKKAEEEVRTSRDYYLKLFDELPNPIWRSNTTAKCDYFNKEWLAFTGRPLEQEMGDGWTEGVHPEDLDRCMKTYLDAFGKKEPFEMEYRIRFHDGTYHWLLDIGKPFYGLDGNFAGYIGACYDITRQKKAETELRESRQFLETIINTIPVRVFWKDKDLTYLGCNTPFARDAGFEKPEDIIGKDDYSMGWREQADLYRADDREVIESGIPKLLIEEPQTTPSGERMYLLTSKIPLKDETCKIIGVLGIYLDITARKRAEEELKKSEDKYRLLIEKTNEGVWIIDKDYRTTFVNGRLAEMFGYPQEEMIGKQVREFMPDEDMPLHLRRIYERLEGKSDLFEQKFIRGDGSSFWAIASVTPLEEDDKVVGAFAMLTDIDERKRIEDALKESNRKLNILSGITRHDITNQLMQINGFLKILEKKQPDSAGNTYFQKIEMATGRIAAMIRFTQTYESVGVNAPVWQDVRTLAETAAKQAPLGDVVLVNEIPTGTEIFADPLIVKVFYNLMENAARYGGKITTLRFYIRESPDMFIIVCEDDGSGIPADEKERIFGRGFGKHTGLGLFLAREILDITRITIRETGEPGMGARFEICVPEGAHRYLDKK